MMQNGRIIRQYLGFDGPAWLICYIKWKELNGPLGNPARGITVVYYVIEWYFGSHHDGALLEVVS